MFRSKYHRYLIFYLLSQTEKWNGTKSLLLLIRNTKTRNSQSALKYIYARYFLSCGDKEGAGHVINLYLNLAWKVNKLLSL
jgi:hypothetical protein